MAVLFNILLPVFIVAAISAFAYIKLKFDLQTISKAAFYIFSPSLVLDSLINSDVSGDEFGWIALATTLTICLVWGLGEGLSRITKLNPKTQAAFIVCTMSSNSSNYGLPVILFALGETGLARAALYVSVNALLRSSLGVYLAARGSIPSPVSALRRVFSVPVVYAAILGLVLNLSHIALPEPVIKAAHILGQGLVPASLVVLGAQIVETFRKQSQIHNRPALTLAVFVKLIIAPVIAIVVTFLLGLKGLTQKVVILETATPSAVLSLVLATEFHTDEAFAALTVLVTTLVSFVTVALWLHFVIMR